MSDSPGPTALSQLSVGAHAEDVTLQDSVVAAVLRSPLHREVVILVGRPERKSWWRNFRVERDVDLLLAGHWTPMSARAVVGSDDPALAERLLETYRRRFRRAASGLRAQDAVLVWCRPR